MRHHVINIHRFSLDWNFLTDKKFFKVLFVGPLVPLFWTWWGLLWVSKPEWVAFFALGRGRRCTGQLRWSFKNSLEAIFVLVPFPPSINQILGIESFTKWFLGAQVCESNVLVFLLPLNAKNFQLFSVLTTRTALTDLQNVSFVGPSTFQNFGAKSQKQPLKWLYKSHNQCDTRQLN